MSAPVEGDALVIVAHAVRTRGLKGEVVAELLTDFPERFEGLETLVGVGPAGRRQQLPLERFWFQRNRVVLKFEGYDSIEAAEDLVGLDFGVPEGEIVALEPDEYYDWQLEGCRLQTLEGQSLGSVRQVLRTGGAPVLVSVADGREYLVPLVASIAVEIDTEAKVIRVDPPEGLLEL